MLKIAAGKVSEDVGFNAGTAVPNNPCGGGERRVLLLEQREWGMKKGKAEERNKS